VSNVAATRVPWLAAERSATGCRGNKATNLFPWWYDWYPVRGSAWLAWHPSPIIVFKAKLGTQLQLQAKYY